MSHRRKRFALLGTVALLAAAGMVRAQQPAPATPAPEAATAQEPAKGRISGSIVSARTGEILKGVSLTLRGMSQGRMSPGPPLMRQANSGFDGRFVFEELPAAEYDLTARKHGYGAQNYFRPQLRLRLGADEKRDDIVVRLQPSAVVTGRVFDAYGEPLPEAEVYAITRRIFPGRAAQRMVAERAQTNDLGEYRLHSLDPGKYVLAARPPRATNPRGVGYAEFTTSYYPAASSVEEAAAIKLVGGAELNGVDFRLELAPETTLRGIVTYKSTGEPCGDCGLQFERDSFMGSVGLSVRPTLEGVFVVHGLRGGLNSVIVHSTRSRRPATFIEQFQTPQSGETEISLVVGASQKVSGEFILEGSPDEAQAGPEGQAPPGGQRPPMMFSLESAGAFPYAGDRGTVPPQGGPFELGEIPPGDYRIRLFGPAGGHLRLVTLNGRELEGPRVTVPSDGPLTGLKLHIAFGGASVSGVVKPAAGGQTEDIRGEQFVIVAPDDPESYAQAAVVRVQLDGTFTVRGLLPASYTVFAAPNPYVDIADPDLRRALKPYSQQITLKQDEQARVELAAVPDSIELW